MPRSRRTRDTRRWSHEVERSHAEVRARSIAIDARDPVGEADEKREVPGFRAERLGKDARSQRDVVRVLAIAPRQRARDHVRLQPAVGISEEDPVACRRRGADMTRMALAEPAAGSASTRFMRTRESSAISRRRISPVRSGGSVVDDDDVDGDAGLGEQMANVRSMRASSSRAAITTEQRSRADRRPHRTANRRASLAVDAPIASESMRQPSCRRTPPRCRRKRASGAWVWDCGIRAVARQTPGGGACRCYLMPITIESGPTSGSTRVDENPAASHPARAVGAGVVEAARRLDEHVEAHHQPERVLRSVVVDDRLVDDERAAGREARRRPSRSASSSWADPSRAGCGPSARRRPSAGRR